MCSYRMTAVDRVFLVTQAQQYRCVPVFVLLCKSTRDLLTRREAVEENNTTADPNVLPRQVSHTRRAFKVYITKEARSLTGIMAMGQLIGAASAIRERCEDASRYPLLSDKL